MQTFVNFEAGQRRNTISQLVVAGDFDGLKGMGIEVIEKEGDVHEGFFETAFPLSDYPKNILSKVIPTLEEDFPKFGDVAIYFNTESKAITLVGRVIKNGRVRSRWGSGGILCEHLPCDVPVSLGKELEIFYFSEPKKFKVKFGLVRPLKPDRSGF